MLWDKMATTAVDPKARIVRFKMRVIDCDMSEPTLARVRLNGVFDTEPQDEHGSFILGEPQGPIRFQVKDPKVAALFVEGQDYYIDFVPTFQERGSNQGEPV
jgi:hypothetical protein